METTISIKYNSAMPAYVVLVSHAILLSYIYINKFIHIFKQSLFLHLPYNKLLCN